MNFNTAAFSRTVPTVFALKPAVLSRPCRRTHHLYPVLIREVLVFDHRIEVIDCVPAINPRGATESVRMAATHPIEAVQWELRSIPKPIFDAGIAT